MIKTKRNYGKLNTHDKKKNIKKSFSPIKCIMNYPCAINSTRESQSWNCGMPLLLYYMQDSPRKKCWYRGPLRGKITFE